MLMLIKVMPFTRFTGPTCRWDTFYFCLLVRGGIQ